MDGWCELPYCPDSVGTQRWKETSSCGETSFTQPLQHPVHWLTWAPGREVHHQTHFYWTFPIKTRPCSSYSVFTIPLDWRPKLRQIIAEKHLIVLMHTSLWNTAALWYCLCCSDLVLFVDLFSFICFLSFDYVRVCVWNNAIFGNERHAWTGLGDIFGLYWFPGVCPSGWGRTCICHSCHSHTHACPCEEWAALSPLLFR